MHLIIEVFAGFVSLIWLGLMLVNLPGAKKKPDYTKNNGFNPKVLVMLPCKGADLTLDSNIKSLKNQDYKNFTMVAIVDSKDDEAVKSLES
ncbi:glycosyltransferase family 2 protein, partial [Candidatus Marsarchaeota archaeon]|nr:glycosyltransferase family 2 protein [Candidatus Marsarchaeota archaeon]